jgi:sodium/potassium/calcium exchanger 4
MWWEATILVTLLVFYWILMFQNKRIVRAFKYVIEERLLWCQRIRHYDIANQRPMTQAEIDGKPEQKEPEHKPYATTNDEDPPNFDKLKERRQSTNLAEIYAVQEEEEYKLFELPRGISNFQLFWFFFTWPIRFMLHYTIPHPLKFKKLFAISFIMCVVWIAVMSYLVFWMVVVVGDTFGIPDPVMALTFLAFGGCMPEAISAVIVARKGSGQMGVSNALGANCLAILFSLGLPWFIRTMVDGAGWNDAHIRIYSYGVEFTLIAIIFAVVLLYIVVTAAGYKLRKTVGAILFLGYLGFATFAILVEIDVLFERECKWKE